VYDRELVEPLARQGITRGTDDEVRAQLEQELSRLEEDDPFTALGVTYDADDGAVRAAFLTATKQLHPNRFARRDREVLRIANEVYLRVKDAYLSIQEASQRRAELARLGKGTAPQRVAAGTAAPTAAPAREAAPRKAGTPARATDRPVRRISTRRRRQARQMTDADELKQQVLAKERAVEEEYARGKRLLLADNDADGAVALFRKLAANHTAERHYRKWLHFAMGRKHEAANDHGRARDEYRRALEVDPTFAPAQEALAKLPEQETQKKGLFSKLFQR